MMRIEVVSGDITQARVDAIVNAANPSLLGGGGVDGAIHRAAGPHLVEFCRTLGGCPPGEARLSPGFKCPAEWIIHTVGPIWIDGEHHEATILDRCYRSCLTLADQCGADRLAFPAISCGVYGYPIQQAAEVAIDALRDARTSVTLVQLYAYNAEVLNAYLARGVPWAH
jgi:O-acetyl-ADP-ribose deacetylase (regulator of RNase III)